MKVLFLLSDYVLHNALLSDYAAARPGDDLAVVKIPLVLKGKGRRSTAGRIVPQLSKRFLAGKLMEFLGLGMVTVLPKMCGRGAVFRRLRRICAGMRLPFHRTQNVMDPETLEFVREFAPDVIVSLCHQILREPLISAAPLGIVNIHPGVLPEFRGIQPYFWQLSEGAPNSGATLHLIEDEQVDAGGVLGRTRFPNKKGTSVQLNYYLTIRSASELLPRCLAALEQGRLLPQPQKQGEGAYYRWPDSEAFDRLGQVGSSLFTPGQLAGILLGHHDRMDGLRSELSL
jgi:methionyl-tRNA formyltransferase